MDTVIYFYTSTAANLALTKLNESPILSARITYPNIPPYYVIVDGDYDEAIKILNFNNITFKTTV